MPLPEAQDRLRELLERKWPGTPQERAAAWSRRAVRSTMRADEDRAAGI